MAAQFHEVGQPATDKERIGLRFLAERLPDDYAVYGNPWLVQRDGRVLELDAVVAGKNAIYIVEIKSYHGTVRGGEHDWDVGARHVKSPVKLNRVSAQILKGELMRRTGDARRIWVQGFVFLSHAERFKATDNLSRDLVYTRSGILGALQNVPLIQRLSGSPVREVPRSVADELDQFLRGADTSRRPRRTLDGYKVLSVFDRTERYTELHARHRASDTERILRFYEVQPLASGDEIEAVRRRVQWESDVLQSLRHPHILRADLMAHVEGGFALPMEYFAGVSLNTWLRNRTDDKDSPPQQDHIPACVHVWSKMVSALQHAHDEGVVHRLLRPDVIWLSDEDDETDLRVGGFELAKRLGSEQTASWTVVGDARLDFAAPEVIAAFTDAGPESDQFSLGALLGLLLAGKPLFERTLDYMKTGRLITRPSDFNGRIPRALDDAVARMLALRSTDRFPSLEEAKEAVVRAVEPRRQRRPAAPEEPLDPDNLAQGIHLGEFDVVGKLGQGGLAVVYKATLRITGDLRALKVARPTQEAEEALLREHKLASQLHHPSIVKVGDPRDSLIPGRIVLVMEHVEGQTLKEWLKEHPDADVDTRRRFAEDLLAALEYLEQENVTHNDLKPDNLLVGKGGLRVIDFSLAGDQEGEPAVGGTARYRDVASHVWSHASDRYAAALCLFELFVGRHAFGGAVRELDEELRIEENEVDPPGLAELFRRALHHVPGERYASARKLRDELREALGARTADEAEPAIEQGDITAETEIHRLALSNRAVNQLRRSGVATVADLLALSPEQVRAIHSVGRKTADEILRVQDELRRQGLEAGRLEAGAGQARPLVPPVLFPKLVEGDAVVHGLPAIFGNLNQVFHRADPGSLRRLEVATLQTIISASEVGAGQRRHASLTCYTPQNGCHVR